MNTSAPIRYPRKTIARAALRLLGRVLFPLFARVRITGRENLPRKGPVILAGNHVAFLEVALMVVYPPYQVELVGTGDIPIDPTFAPLAKLYGFIPINRGNLDRAGLYLALDVLRQGGVVGIFPEGGIWNPEAMQAQTGVAWLSSQAQAPVVPIGFGGMRGAIKAMLRLQRPRLTMNIGAPIPAVQVNRPDLSRKAALAEGANHILRCIQELVPPEERRRSRLIRDERYWLEIQTAQAGTEDYTAMTQQRIEHGAALAQLLMQPVLMDVFVTNLKMEAVRPLQNLNQPYPAADIQVAAAAVLAYLETNRGFLTYRFGMETGLAMQSGMRELCDLALEAAQENTQLWISPVHTYSTPDTGAVVERGSQAVESR